jgi:hypothetical protein
VARPNADGRHGPDRSIPEVAVIRPLAIALVLSTSSGCRALAELVEREPEDELALDAATDGPPCDPWTFMPAGLDPCVLPQPSGGAIALTTGRWSYDTNSGSLTDPDQNASFPSSSLVRALDGTELRVVSAEALVVDPDAVLEIRGSRPLLLLSWSDARIAGAIDATSHPDAPAAGSDPSACDGARATPGGDDPEGAGGGGGGGLGLAGASGGAGNATLTAGGQGGAAATPPIALRGGCDGGRGGNALGGAGGAGGGAIAIVARHRLDVSGVITAGGAGGGPAQGGRSGGGGGGSGGVILLSAPAVSLAATTVLAANGGGGGGGSDGSPALPGQAGRPGADPSSGGSGQGMGGDGGDGGAANNAAVAGTSPRRGGGGGGGAIGVIVLSGTEVLVDDSAVVSPPPTL